jgi:hypothetical protein
MTDGCAHTPSRDIAGAKVASFIKGPYSTSRSCVATPSCDQSHIFRVRNFHLYDIKARVDASSSTGAVETCNDTEDIVKQTQWTMKGTVLAAPYRPSKGELPYREKRLGTRVRSLDNNDGTQDFISVWYEITSPEDTQTGLSFNFPVDLL